MTPRLFFLAYLASLFLGSACQSPAPPKKQTSPAPVEDTTAYEPRAPQWAAQATIYEVNIRQYTPEGTINAFREHLGRLDSMGVKILWIMPVQPIGKKNRKGPLGSYYSIQDYTSVNPEFGTITDFKALVKEAHERGMHVILDWVANHTAYDHPWTRQHPDWYTRDSTGAIVSPVADWSDVADLNYQKPGLRKAMRDAMRFWVEKAGVDGFRCDVAMMVPMDFWVKTRRSLDSLKDVFLLAEAEGPAFYQAFDMTYGWELHHLMNETAQGESSPARLMDYILHSDSAHGPADLRMYFTTNHDENSWNGTVFERLGANHRNFFVLAATLPHGMPLVYSGQEAGLDKRLRFFDKDTIPWGQRDSLYQFYHDLLHLKRSHPALVNQTELTHFTSLRADSLSQGTRLLAYEMRRGQHKLRVYLNFGETSTPVLLNSTAETWYNARSNQLLPAASKRISVPAHGYRLLSSVKTQIPAL
jgi:glycosidase